MSQSKRPKVYLLANPKGGVGKSTVATNLAGLLAHRPDARGVMLGDTDRQYSARDWLQRRPKGLPTISGWDLGVANAGGGKLSARVPRNCTHVVLDSPAGLQGELLRKLLGLADVVVVPLAPSMFDISATRDFLDSLAKLKSARDAQIGLLGVRVDPRQHSAEQFKRFVASTDLPLIGCLRDTQNYVHLAAYGLSVFDVATQRVAADREQWAEIENWLPL